MGWRTNDDDDDLLQKATTTKGALAGGENTRAHPEASTFAHTKAM